jgi:transcriptional regulator with XRE-family HTH domain
MPNTDPAAVGQRIATERRAHRMTQQDLAKASGVSYGMIRAIERGARTASDSVLDALAGALRTDPLHLLSDRRRAGRLQAALPGLSSAVAAWDDPDDGPVRPLPELRAAVSEAVQLRLAAQYLRLAQEMPALLAELARAFHDGQHDRRAVAGLLAAAYRAADAAAYKGGSHDLSARLVDLMRWAAQENGDTVLMTTAAYVRTEVYFASKSHAAGLRALGRALGASPGARTKAELAARGALHMRSAVIAGRAGEHDAATEHLDRARHLGDQVPEGIYSGTAFGPSSVRVHEVSTAVAMGDQHAARALRVAREWKPGDELPPERRSGFYVELARAQMWGGHREDAFESLKVARRIAPQHVRDHPWAQQDAATLRRLARADRESLTAFAEWIGVV